MGIHTDRLNQSFKSFINDQSVFFVATAAPTGRVNLSPKGLDAIRVIDDQTIIWLNLSGSGNETAAHILQSPRMTLMFCGFDEQMLILRVYGQAHVIHPRDQDWEKYYALFPDYAGARNIFELSIDLVTTSCGSGVPEMAVKSERGETELVPFYEQKGIEGTKNFWRKKNITSLDGWPTGIFKDSNE